MTICNFGFGALSLCFCENQIFPYHKRTCLQLLENIGCYWDGFTNQCLSLEVINNHQLINYVWCRDFQITPIPAAQLSITGDTVNRLDFHSTKSCALYPQESFPVIALHGVWRWDERNRVFRRDPLGHCRCPSIFYHSSRSTGTVHPEPRIGSTKPEPIMACGCIGKLPIKVYPYASSWLGESFRKMSWRFSMHPWDNHWVLQAARPSILHPVVNSSPSWASWILEVAIILTLTSPMWITQPTPSTKHSIINYNVTGHGNIGIWVNLPHDTTQELDSVSPTCMHGGKEYY